jgi:anti-sigma regulatory factor (Ser/Thr protein kinase)
MAVRASASFPRERARVPVARGFTRRALTTAGVRADVVDRMVLAVAEACNNATLHAAGDDFTVTVSVDTARVVVTISDDGDGFLPPARPSMPHPQSTGHRGLALMRAMVDHVDVVSTGQGTTVTLMHVAAPLDGVAGNGAGDPARSSLAG